MGPLPAASLSWLSCNPFSAIDYGSTDRLALEMPGYPQLEPCWPEAPPSAWTLVPPVSSGTAQQELEDLSSPIGAFLRDRCDVHGKDEWERIEIGQLFEAWCTWCRDNNHGRPGTAQMFGRDLRAALPELVIERPKKTDGSEGRSRFYKRELP